MQKRFENRERPAAAPLPPEFVFSERQAAEFLRVSAITLRRDRATSHAGGIPFVRIGARIVYLREALEIWLREQQQRPVPREFATPSHRVRRGRPAKKEQIEAAQRGLTVSQLRERQSQVGGAQ